MKKQWVSPELIVLLRTRPEESVLLVCKTGGLNLPGIDHTACSGGPKDCLVNSKS